jgi:hypothetical protein
MEAPLFTGYALADHSCIFIDQNAHPRSPRRYLQICFKLQLYHYISADSSQGEKPYSRKRDEQPFLPKSARAWVPPWNKTGGPDEQRKQMLSSVVIRFLLGMKIGPITAKK